MAIKEIVGKVVEHKMFWSYDEDAYTKVEKVAFKPDVCGEYFMKAINPASPTRNWRRSWEELEIKKVADGLYHLYFYAVSSPRFDIRTEAFMVLEMTKEQVINWHDTDVWFSGEYHYIIRRAGKKVYGAKDNRRCIKCQYLLRNDATKCDRDECELSK